MYLETIENQPKKKSTTNSMAEVDTAAYEAAIDADKRLNKSEKKARKALSKLGLKPVAGVSRVTMKKSPAIMFLISNPEVFKSPGGGGQETYVVYGVCQIDDGQMRGRNFMPPTNFAPPPGMGTRAQEVDEEEEAPAAEAPSSDGGPDEEQGDLTDKDIEMVMTQVKVDRNTAIRTLKKNNGDIINSIMDLTM